MTRAKRLPTPAFAALLVLGLGTGAGAQTATRSEPLHWSHPAPAEVAGYHVHYGMTSGSYPVEIDVGIPATDASGNFAYELQVPVAEVVYVAVSAYDTASMRSDLSNEGIRTPPPEPLGQPGQPIPILP